MDAREATPKELRKPASRFCPPDEIRLIARTLGSKFKFEIPIANMSQTGLLLEWRRVKPTLPFLENTLLEMELLAPLNGEHTSLNIMGKVIRRETIETGIVYGIKIIHNDDREQHAWTNLVTEYLQVSQPD